MSIIPSSGPVSFSLIQSIFGGPATNISLSSYYTNAIGGYTTGVTGIPSSGNPILITHFLGKGKAGGNALYYFSTFTFTNAGATGRTGPILSQCQSAYSSQTWAQNTSYFNMTTQGIQLWTVPVTGSYKIDAFGAAGGSSGLGRGGYGANITTNVNLIQGQVLAIVVGQMGQSTTSSGLYTCGGGGGGGTFIYDSTTLTYYVAVGGGGGRYLLQHIYSLQHQQLMEMELRHLVIVQQ